MKQQPSFDIDLDKHYNPTVVIACTQCGHETRQHLDTLAPDQAAALRCDCGADISLDSTALDKAHRLAADIKQSYRIH
ncbi:hypothetical protein NH8B_0195 [Pseudogulbenkiania sp. NH8B]|uniref:Uncharacterized protein n=1 Tax=Pseudogulbenkiania ferrooxidans 2002 TaxID=279714 RepID=B9Z5R9_9NEIS|nr:MULTISPECIES: hypothetical protein [Pseudogulbenkiania]EEG07916.1 conserved hypothetical protein [Pseudogulbenkiania ferrooxidans 2002]BAK75044.1 hypothetical protein NH8B_0195 [Pseudogulbenkiania sp. NH8B]